MSGTVRKALQPKKVPVGRHERFRPLELVRLEIALNELHFLATVGRSSWSDGRVQTSSDHQPRSAIADSATSAARKDLEHFLDRIHHLGADIADAVTRDPKDEHLKATKRWEKRNPWCARCKKGMRRGARYCDRCGRPLGE